MLVSWRIRGHCDDCDGGYTIINLYWGWFIMAYHHHHHDPRPDPHPHRYRGLLVTALLEIQ